MKQKLLLLLAFACLGGCGYDLAQEPPATVKVTGKVVNAGGQPLTLGTIRFEPVGAGKGTDAFGELGAGGTFTVKSYGNREGIRPGSYVAYLDPATFMTLDATGKKMVPKPAAAGIPVAFFKADTSKWKIEVTESTTDLGTLKLQ